MDLGEVPVGFSVKLAQSETATLRYAALTEEAKQDILGQAHDIRLKEDMHRLGSNFAINRTLL